jgi:hypothetical protein
MGAFREENKVYGFVSAGLKADYPSLSTVSTPVSASATFPCVSIFEAGNIAHPSAVTLDNRENVSSVTFEINAYSNKKTGAKAEATDLIWKADELMQDLGFIRSSLVRTPNWDGNIFRLTSRYQRLAAPGEIDYSS